MPSGFLGSQVGVIVEGVPPGPNGQDQTDAEAFHHVTDALQCDLREVILLDDNDMNVAAARSVDMQAVRIRG